jgi:hypothetical protein
VTRRKAQHDYRFLEPRRRPLTPDYMSLPESRHTAKRLTRATVKELTQPKQMVAPEPKPAMVASVENLHDKLVRFGWISTSGQSLDWRYWNRYPKPYFRSEPQD